jgi:hypothetical protein
MATPTIFRYEMNCLVYGHNGHDHPGLVGFVTRRSAVSLPFASKFSETLIYNLPDHVTFITVLAFRRLVKKTVVVTVFSSA